MHIIIIIIIISIGIVYPIPSEKSFSATEHRIDKIKEGRRSQVNAAQKLPK